MKLFTSLLAIPALSFAVSAYAQEESPSATPQETASASVEAATSTPAPAATPETKASPAAQASPAASPAALKKEAAAAKKESPSGATSKKEKAAEPAGPDKGSAESNVKRLEDEWEAAFMKHDATFLQARVAEDCTGTSSKGKRITKGSLIKELKANSDTYTSAKNAGVTVRSFGPNVAIATGTAKEVGKGKDGKAFSRTYVWTDTWMLRNGKWECIGSHSMLVSGK